MSAGAATIHARGAPAGDRWGEIVSESREIFGGRPNFRPSSASQAKRQIAGCATLWSEDERGLGLSLQVGHAAVG